MLTKTILVLCQAAVSFAGYSPVGGTYQQGPASIAAPISGGNTGIVGANTGIVGAGGGVQTPQVQTPASDIDPALLVGSQQGLPGLKVRVNQPTFQQASQLLGGVLSDEIKKARLPPISKCIPQANGCLEIYNLYVSRYRCPQRIVLMPSPPNRIKFQIRNVDIGITGNLGGQVTILSPIPLAGIIQLNVHRATVIVELSIEQGPQGPYLAVASCKAKAAYADAYMENAGLLGQMVNTNFRSRVGKMVRKMIPSQVCGMVPQLVQEKINGQLGSMLPKSLPISPVVPVLLNVLGVDNSAPSIEYCTANCPNFQTTTTTTAAPDEDEDEKESTTKKDDEDEEEEEKKETKKSHNREDEEEEVEETDKTQTKASDREAEEEEEEEENTETETTTAASPSNGKKTENVVEKSETDNVDGGSDYDTLNGDGNVVKKRSEGPTKKRHRAQGVVGHIVSNTARAHRVKRHPEIVRRVIRQYTLGKGYANPPQNAYLQTVQSNYGPAQPPASYAVPAVAVQPVAVQAPINQPYQVQGGYQQPQAQYQPQGGIQQPQYQPQPPTQFQQPQVPVYQPQYQPQATYQQPQAQPIYEPTQQQPHIVYQPAQPQVSYQQQPSAQYQPAIGGAQQPGNTGIAGPAGGDVCSKCPNGTGDPKNMLREIFKQLDLNKLNDLSLSTQLLGLEATHTDITVNLNGEISPNGQGGAPFGAFPMQFPSPTDNHMVELLAGDYVINTLLYQMHRKQFFSINVPHSAPGIGALLKTTCTEDDYDDTDVQLDEDEEETRKRLRRRRHHLKNRGKRQEGDLLASAAELGFCLGTLMPTVQEQHPKQNLSLHVTTGRAPSVLIGTSNGTTITLNVLLNADVFIDGTNTLLGTLEVTMTFVARLDIANGRATGTVEVSQLKLRDKTGTLGSKQDTLDNLSGIVQGGLPGLFNPTLAKGIPLELPPNALSGLPFTIIGQPDLNLVEHGVHIAANIGLNPSALGLPASSGQC